MKITILIKLMISFLIVGMIPLIIVGIISLQDAKKIGYGAAKDAENLGAEAVADTTSAITELVGDAFLKIANQLSKNIRDSLEERKTDARTLANLVAVNSMTPDSLQQTLLGISKSKQSEIWFNTGTDASPKEERATIPLYAELAYIDETGMEIAKVVNGEVQTELNDVSKPENTAFKTETYFEKAKALKSGEVYVSRLNTWYLTEEEARKSVPEDTKEWNIVPGRDVMKTGNVRFAAPVYTEDVFKGIVVLSLDYRHIQEWTKHVDPALSSPVVSTTYEGNYILMYDDKGDTLVHPKPNNIRGYLENGTLEHRNTVATPGGIFNLNKFDKSETYKEIYEQTIQKGETLVKSAVDVKGRNKMTISVPIAFDSEEYKDSGFFGGIMLSVNTDKFYETARRTEKKISEKIAATNARIKLSTEGMQTENTILAVTLVTILLVIILGIIAANTISRPIRELTRVANIISEANVDVEIPEIRTRDEIYDLAESLKAVLAAVDFFREELGMNKEK
ncbi:MAG: cache and HAMP domain-containing protein [Deltaproteobacteria bacterium]|nr:cache and HAMP domain-containing protein [Deltaproteobacteria bacterium]MBN2674378.1 cache and HAMP domain-containing protein [Deltaproteobacteria bacterium]